MLKKKSTMIICFLLLFFAMTGFDQKTFKKDFASFDQAFIPPLALTNGGQAKPSQKGMKILLQNWKTLKAKYYDANPDDSGWKQDFEKIETQLKAAERIIESGQDLMRAHEELEEIRIITMEMRKRNNMDYFMDSLTEFHILMEAMFHMGQDNSPEDLSPGMIKELRGFLAEAKILWEKIGESSFDAALFGFSDRKTAQMRLFYEKEMSSLQDLEKAIEGDDKAAVIQAAKGVKPNYAMLYKMFGDFERIRKN